MHKTYKRNGANYELSLDENVIFEGIYCSSSLSTGEVILSMVEEYTLSPKGIKTLRNIYIDNFIHLTMLNVSWV